MALFTFTSVVQTRDYAVKNHMNTHHFRCSDLNEWIVIIIIIIVIIMIIIIMIIIITIIIMILITIILKVCEEILIGDQNILFEYIFYNRVS